MVCVLSLTGDADADEDTRLKSVDYQRELGREISQVDDGELAIGLARAMQDCYTKVFHKHKAGGKLEAIEENLEHIAADVRSNLNTIF